MGSYKFKNLFTNLKTNNQKQSLELSFLWDFCCKELYCYADVYRLTFIGKSSRLPNVLTHHRYRFSKTRIKVFPNSAFFAKGDQPLESVIGISKYSQIFWSILIANFDSFESAISYLTYHRLGYRRCIRFLASRLSSTEFTCRVIFLLFCISCSSNMTKLQGPFHW